jgi:hypothetical protein
MFFSRLMFATAALASSTVHGISSPPPSSSSGLPVRSVTPMGSPEYDGFVLLKEELIDNGTFVIAQYGWANETGIIANPDAAKSATHSRSQEQATSPTAPPLAKRCGSNQVSCDFSRNLAPLDLCLTLINRMAGAPENGQPTPGARLQCSLRPGNINEKCCIGWAHVLNQGTTNHVLVPAAVDTYNRCQRGGRVSGLAVDVLLGSTCTKQCLSNPGDWCLP